MPGSYTSPAMKPVLAVDELVGIIPRSNGSQVQVRRCRTAEGYEYVDARIWDRTWGANTHRATKHGFACPVEQLPALLEALQKAAR